MMPNNESVHDVLLCLNAPIAKCPMPVCIRLFAEHQPAVSIQKDVLDEMNTYYGRNVGFNFLLQLNIISHLKSVFVETGFSGDDDGLASIARINAEVDDSTGGRVSCVFRDNNGPNRRAQMVLVSAVDCTFYWSFHGKRKPLIKCPFYDSPNRDSSTMRYIYVPRSSVLCSVRLSECTNKKHWFGFRRIFDREKSDLSGIFYRSHSFYPYFVTLWEHYHLAQFTIVPEPPSSSATSKNKDLVDNKLKMATQKAMPHKNQTGAPADLKNRQFELVLTSMTNSCPQFLFEYRKFCEERPMYEFSSGGPLSV
ncbi:unnamed protein product [Angiostrongylus costaricensis]|uniref:RGS domain-containing protein n=1 Tax=Angiostrongylus costaricensis TaxID=334426 RepID=A0A158PGV8_ANGCS|nr:unnamed protein product [Angiostrongylus costaricensis]